MFRSDTAHTRIPLERGYNVTTNMLDGTTRSGMISRPVHEVPRVKTHSDNAVFPVEALPDVLCNPPASMIVTNPEREPDMEYTYEMPSRFLLVPGLSDRDDQRLQHTFRCRVTKSKTTASGREDLFQMDLFDAHRSGGGPHFYGWPLADSSSCTTATLGFPRLWDVWDCEELQVSTVEYEQAKKDGISLVSFRPSCLTQR